jgi:hypothetical protein
MGRLGAMLDLLRGRGIRLESGGRTLDLGRVGTGFESPFGDATYWIKRLSGATDLNGRTVVPVFTTEEAARRWPGDGDVTSVPGSVLGEALAADGTTAAAIDPAGLEVLRRGPDAPDDGARWVRLRG